MPSTLTIDQQTELSELCRTLQGEGKTPEEAAIVLLSHTKESVWLMRTMDCTSDAETVATVAIALREVGITTTEIVRAIHDRWGKWDAASRDHLLMATLLSSSQITALEAATALLFLNSGLQTVEIILTYFEGYDGDKNRGYRADVIRTAFGSYISSR